MELPIVERRQIENEMIFRRSNEKVGIYLDEVDASNIEDGNPHLVRHNDMILEFRCECSDENCDARIRIRLSVYRQIHLDRDAYVIKLKHQVNPIEKVVLTESDYCVVKTNHSTAEPGDLLNITTATRS